MNQYYKIYAWAECPYCIKAKELLTRNNKQFMFCCIDDSKELLTHIKEKYNWMTVPMITKHTKTSSTEWTEEFVGGFSDLVKIFGGSDEETNS